MISSASKTVFSFDISLGIPFKIIFPLIELHVFIFADIFHFLIMHKVLFIVSYLLFSQIDFFILCQMIFSYSLFDFFQFVDLLRWFSQIETICCCSCFHSFEPLLNWLHHCLSWRLNFMGFCISEIYSSSNTIDFIIDLKLFKKLLCKVQFNLDCLRDVC